MPTLELTSMDLAKGLRCKNLDVPDMEITASLDNLSADQIKKIEKQTVPVNKLVLSAAGELNKVKADIQAAVMDVDNGWERNPPPT